VCVSVDCQLATAPTNGSVVLWNIEKRTKSKLGKLSSVMVVCVYVCACVVRGRVSG